MKSKKVLIFATFFQTKPLNFSIQNSSRGHNYWIACSGWTVTFKENHRTFAIPDDVDEGLLVKLFRGEPIHQDSDQDTGLCSKLVPSHIGRKQATCRECLLHLLQPFLSLKSSPAYRQWQVSIPGTDCTISMSM
jgi:hypothetical protein